MGPAARILVAVVILLSCASPARATPTPGVTAVPGIELDAGAVLAGEPRSAAHPLGTVDIFAIRSSIGAHALDKRLVMLAWDLRARRVVKETPIAPLAPSAARVRAVRAEGGETFVVTSGDT